MLSSFWRYQVSNNDLKGNPPDRRGVRLKIESADMTWDISRRNQVTDRY